MKSSNTNEHWSRYWAYGALTSLPQDFKKNYDGELAEFWSQKIASLNDGCKILDLCTGNLSLPLLIKQLAYKAKIKIEVSGVDLAKINKQAIKDRHPELNEWLSEIEIIDGTAIENLGEKISEPVDLITSQYGLEYCNTEKIAPQIYGLLKNEGRLVFVAHAADTAILSAMQMERLAFDFLNQIRVFETLESYGSGRFKPEYFKKKITKQLKELHQKLVQEPIQLLQIFHQALGGLSQLSNEQLLTQKDAILEFYLQHWQAQMRASDLLQVSEKIMKNPAWYKAFETEGLVLKQKKSIIYQGKHNAGTAFEFIKPTKQL